VVERYVRVGAVDHQPVPEPVQEQHLRLHHLEKGLFRLYWWCIDDVFRLYLWCIDHVFKLYLWCIDDVFRLY
jgi:hypothetical protein